MVLSPDFCLAKTMVSRSLKYYDLPADLDEFAIASWIKKNHLQNKENVITA
jgi:hypothetical protein